MHLVYALDNGDVATDVLGVPMYVDSADRSTWRIRCTTVVALPMHLAYALDNDDDAVVALGVYIARR